MTVLSKPANDGLTSWAEAFLFPVAATRRIVLAKKNCNRLSTASPFDMLTFRLFSNDSEYDEAEADDAEKRLCEDAGSLRSTVFQAALGAALNAGTMHRLLATGVGMGMGGVAMSCMPVVAPFNTPPVHYSAWSQNKRACAFQRYFVCKVIFRTKYSL